MSSLAPRAARIRAARTLDLSRDSIAASALEDEARDQESVELARIHERQARRLSLAVATAQNRARAYRLPAGIGSARASPDAGALGPLPGDREIVYLSLLSVDEQDLILPGASDQRGSAIPSGAERSLPAPGSRRSDHTRVSMPA